MNIRDHLGNFDTKVPSNLSLSLNCIMHNIQLAQDMGDFQILVSAKRDGATVTLMDDGGFEDVRATVFTMDDDCEWTATECVGTVEMMKAMYPHIDTMLCSGIAIDKENEDGVH